VLIDRAVAKACVATSAAISETATCPRQLLKRVREARKLNNLPNSLLDYNDAKRGLEPPTERRAREQRDMPQPRGSTRAGC
jgi:hypothetical protein